MIKIFLKHLIYEQCINVIFEQIIYNFSAAKKKHTKYLRGKRVYPNTYSKLIKPPIFTGNVCGMYVSLKYSTRNSFII